MRVFVCGGPVDTDQFFDEMSWVLAEIPIKTIIHETKGYLRDPIKRFCGYAKLDCTALPKGASFVDCKPDIIVSFGAGEDTLDRARAAGIPVRLFSAY